MRIEDIAIKREEDIKSVILALKRNKYEIEHNIKTLDVRLKWSLCDNLKIYGAKKSDGTETLFLALKQSKFSHFWRLWIPDEKQFLALPKIFNRYNHNNKLNNLNRRYMNAD